MTKLPRVSIYSDGSCEPNPGAGGWAALLLFDGKQVPITGAHPETTNNRMELTAAVEALKALPGPHEVKFYTDSEYLRKGISEWLDAWMAKGWRTASKKPIKNKDLWQELAKLQKKHKIIWKWVKGHSGHPENERCDYLANSAIKRRL